MVKMCTFEYDRKYENVFEGSEEKMIIQAFMSIFLKKYVLIMEERF